MGRCLDGSGISLEHLTPIQLFIFGDYWSFYCSVYVCTNYFYNRKFRYKVRETDARIPGCSKNLGQARNLRACETIRVNVSHSFRAFKPAGCKARSGVRSFRASSRGSERPNRLHLQIHASLRSEPPCLSIHPLHLRTSPERALYCATSRKARMTH